MGAVKGQLFWQFMSESVLFTFFALILGIIMAGLALPYFNILANRQLTLHLIYSPWAWTVGVVTGFIVSLLAGSYPSLALSDYLPVKVLKGSLNVPGKNSWIRKSLIVFQFVISIFLIFGTLVILQQLNFIQTKKLGYEKEHVMVLPADLEIVQIINTLKNELKTNSEIREVTVAYETPTHIRGSYGLQKSREDRNIMVNAIPVEKDFVRTLELELIAGSDFTLTDEKLSLLPEDEVINTLILNESAVQELGWTPEEAVGKKVFLTPRKGEIRGVVKDFHYAPMHEPIGPLVIFLERQYGGVLMVKLSGKYTEESIEFIKSKWQELVPHRPFEFTFLDQEYAATYNTEQRVSKIFSAFGILAFFLACLGLFGLAAYTAQQRTKEIGIRKVLGASVANLIGLLSKEIIKLVFVACLIASPLAWWAMQIWLESFVYRVNINWWIFIISGFFALLVALLTMSFQSIKAALANPVNSLRSE
ncbi:hypothetical protein BH23BAC1_BH23BAC1_47510 [soil metagenome]